MIKKIQDFVQEYEKTLEMLPTPDDNTILSFLDKWNAESCMLDVNAELRKRGKAIDARLVLEIVNRGDRDAYRKFVENEKQKQTKLEQAKERESHHIMSPYYVEGKCVCVYCGKTKNANEGQYYGEYLYNTSFSPGGKQTWHPHKVTIATMKKQRYHCNVFRCNDCLKKINNPYSSEFEARFWGICLLISVVGIPVSIISFLVGLIFEFTICTDIAAYIWIILFLIFILYLIRAFYRNVTYKDVTLPSFNIALKQGSVKFVYDN